ncbi:MAG: DMT family transporter [Flavobacteriales bacterium]
MRGSWIAHASLAAASLIYGANYIIAKTVMPNPIGPSSFIVLRVVGACVLFWLIAIKKLQVPERKDWGRFLICAITGVAINQLLFFNGLALTSPVNSSIIMTSNPILVMVISAWMLKQRITPLKLLGLFSGAAGALLLLWQSSQQAHSDSSLLGDVFILINSISWGFYLVLVKPLIAKYHPMMITAWVFFVGIFLVLPFGGLGLSDVDWNSLSAWQWFAVGYVVVATTFLAYLFNMIGVQHVTPTVVSSYIYFQPVLAGVFAYFFSWFLDRDFTSGITSFKILCTMLIFIGVFLVSRSDQRYAV